MTCAQCREVAPPGLPALVMRDKLGSVALWLREHSIDIKVIEIEVYREGETLFLQPHTIIPLPVSRFSDTGRGKGVEPTKPWLEDGQNWHLNRRCGPRTREMMLQLDDLIRDELAVDGPGWNQKHYVAYRVHNYNWLVVETRATMLALYFRVKRDVFRADEIADKLGIAQFDEAESMSEKLNLPSSVLLEHRNESTDEVTLRLKDGFDFGSETFLSFLKEAYEAFPR